METPDSEAAGAPADVAAARFAAGYNCAQAVFSTYAERLGMDHDAALKVAAGFGGGMGRLAETCGAVTGAFMVLGMRHAGAAGDRQAKEAVYLRVVKFAERFKARYGAISCRELLGCDIGTPEGLKRSQELNTHANLCPQFIRAACEILEEMEQTPA